MKEELPSGNISPIGYIVSRFNIQKRGPVKAFQRWLDKIPASYIKAFDFDNIDVPKSIEEDKFCLARLKDYASLMPLAQQARKPMFMLKPSDGALGGHQAAVNSCGADFEALAKRILDQVKAD